ncbi:chorismate--pyruvate lyase family protein [Photobacterium galatheae]|uniref:Probable chorismate pyruvate-lyase n=1 Tax=Photobacterium galatheae TaxID=1654360 RepID=A0A066RTB1_9GAMM|nr:chorismate lyase [Photobacterium galatheae]KDM92346.1 chorismate--pyruvate lyase [Photobacterium galatheae]MCM0150857.1 chorismate lyase [Photobacterium galatheae]
MSKFKQIYQPALDSVDWQMAAALTPAQAGLESWLHEQGSLSRRFARYCHQFSVRLLGQHPLRAQALKPGERQMLGDVDCLERCVLLEGDGVPWVFARTLIPLPTLTGDEHDLAQLGDLPLGYRVFTDQSARRDALQLAQTSLEGKRLWARRSRLWVKEKPMLVAELFLAPAPVYHDGSEQVSPLNHLSVVHHQKPATGFEQK